MQAFGASPAAIQQARAELSAANERSTFEVWPEHWHALSVFRGMATQWRVVPAMGGGVYQGLRYESLPLVIAAHRTNPHRQPLPELMQQLACLERAALDVLNTR